MPRARSTRPRLTVRGKRLSARRVRRLGRPHSRRRVRQERRRQPVRRRVCDRADARAGRVGRAVRVLEARREPAHRNGDARHAQPGDDGRALGRQAAGAASNTTPTRRCRPDRSARDDVSAWAGHYTLRIARGWIARVPDQRRIQLRQRRRATPPTARAARSTSSTRRRTTSTAWPTRSAGATSATCAPASSSRRGKGCRSSRTITRGGSNEKRDGLYAAGGAVLARVRGRRRVSARRAGARHPGDARP